MEVLSIAAARNEASVGRQATVRGWVRSRRDSKGGFSFLELNDGSCFGCLQVVADAALPNYESEIKHVTAGYSVEVVGEVKASPAAQQATELHAATVRVLGVADATTYPLQKKRHSFEFLRTIAHLRPRTNTFGAVARVRNRISRSVHEFFQAEEFLYLQTPIITASDCEGAGEMFRVTTLPQNGAQASDPTEDFFHRSAYLTVSGQLEAETYACGLGKVYTFGPTFRAENSNTSRHLAEFWMIEPEAAFFELADNMDLAERFLKRVLGDVLNHCGEDLEFFQQRIESTIIDTLTQVVESDFVRLPYTDAIAVLESAGQKFEYKPEWGCDLQAEHERYLTETHCKSPVVVHDYPSTIKPFYMRLSDDERTVAAMDVLAPRVGEIIGGSQREERLEVIERRMQAQGLDPEAYWWYLDLRRYGSVPHSGFGLGLERLVQFATGMANIRDVIPFPRFPGGVEF